MAFKFKEFFGVDNYYEEEVPEEQYAEDTAQGSAAPTAKIGRAHV